MPVNRKIYLISSFCALLFAICSLLLISWKSNHLDNIGQYNDWLNNESNRCILTRSIGGVKISIKYQPPLYVALKDIAGVKISPNLKKSIVDSVVKNENQVITFLMIIGPDKDVPERRRSAPITSEGVHEQSDFAERVISTNFYMEQNMNLYVDGVKYKPAISVMENLYELSDQRSFSIAFVSEGGKNINAGNEYIFEYDDPYFNVGKVQFRFSGESFQSARNLRINQN